jgi:hypothetical protein
MKSLSLKQNYDKHVIITVIVLIGLPILLGYSTFALLNVFYQNQIITFFIIKFNDPSIGFQFLSSLVTLQYAIFVVMLILYPIYPFIFSIENHLRKRNPKSALTEYQALKNIVYALFPIFLFTIGLRISSGIIQDNPLSVLILSLDEPLLSLLISFLGAILFAVASALLRIILLNRNKQFKYYLAKLSFRVVSGVEDEVERMKYLIMGLGFYDKYIRRMLGLQINDLKVIYSKMIADVSVDKNRSIKELCRAFEDHDRLKPITCLTGLFDVSDSAHFLAKESAGKKLEGWATIIGTLVSTITAVIGVITTLFSL